MALVRSKSIKQNVGEICAEKGQRESGSKKNECFIVGNPFGHCGEVVRIDYWAGKTIRPISVDCLARKPCCEAG